MPAIRTPLLHTAALYLGVVIVSLFLLFDTQRIMEGQKANQQSFGKPDDQRGNDNHNAKQEIANLKAHLGLQ